MRWRRKGRAQSGLESQELTQGETVHGQATPARSLDMRPTLEQSSFAIELALIMNRAGELKLWRTMHAIHEAVRVVGYELADIQAGKQPGSEGK